jgi:8-oxo-dGTP diphosphatase
MFTKKKRFFTVLAVIFNEKGQVLLSKRDEPQSPLHNLWQFPGGGIEFGEHPKDTAIREIKEEINLDIKVLTEHPFVYHHRFTDTHEVILFVYPAKQLSGEIDTSKDKNTAEAKWFDPKKINFSQTVNITQKALKDITDKKIIGQ